MNINKKKIITKSIITVIISMLVILMAFQNVSDAQTITMSELREMSYSINSKRLYHFAETTGNYNNLYCLNGGAQRNAYEVLTHGGSLYNINDQTVNQIFGSRQNFNSSMWLIDNMYVSNDAEPETKAMMLENIANLIKSKKQVVEQTYGVALDSAWIDGMMADYANRENLIYTVQQGTFWYFTNNLTPNIGIITPDSITGTVIIPGDGKDNSTPYTSTKYYCYIYTAMVSLAKDNSNYISPNANSMQSYLDGLNLDSTNAIIDRTTKKVGPFVLNNNNPSVSDFTRYSVSVNDITIGNDNYDIVKQDNNIYIQFKNGYNFDPTKEYNISLNIDTKRITSDAQYFYTEGNLTTKQPLFNLKKRIVGKRLEGRARTEAVAEFDLHLIKNITDVYVPVNNNGTTSYVLNKTDVQGAPTSQTILTNRVFNRVGLLKNGTTTDAYLTNKAFITVPTGSIIRYKITIHNEGDLDGYASEIKDSLANGLEFVGLEQLNSYGINETTDYRWTKTEEQSEKVSASYKTDYLSSTRGMGNLIKAYDKTTNTIDSRSVYIYCKVTSKDKNTVLKNVAEITADTAYDAKNNYTDINDRDSNPNSITINQLTSNIDSWKGSAEYGPEQMSESYKYNVPGLQDDDDYENIKVQTLDLALTKQIVNVEYKLENDIDSTPVSNRLRAYNVSGLLDGTTATYIMNKPAYKVKTGATVRYKISVYNEGDINGYATEITDYLPQGLEFKQDSLVNIQNNWIATKNSDGTTIVKTNKLKDRELLAYTGGNTLDSDFVEIECVVVSDTVGKLLTNISEITKYGYYIGAEFVEAIADENGKPIVDRDSYENSLNIQLNKTQTTESILEYEKRIETQLTKTWMNKTEYDVEDDDDFEQLIIIDKEFDLALRKYISAVNGNSIVNGVDLNSYDAYVTRVPKINILSEAMRATKGTALYFHGKEAIEVYPQDEITYKLRIYNEGGIADYNGRATEIIDYLPQGVEFVKLAEGYLDYTATVDTELNAIKIMYTGNKILPTNSIKKIAQATENKKYDEISDQWYQEVALICKVTGYEESKILTNRAEITKQIAINSQGEMVQIADRDSVPDSLLIGTNNNTEKSILLNLASFYTDYKYGINDDHMGYYPGVEGKGTKDSQDQDDTDFENIKIKKLLGQYNLQIQKTDAKNPNMKLENVTFSLNTKINGKVGQTAFTATDSNGLTNTITTQIENTEIDSYTINEINLGINEYIKLKNPISFAITKEIVGGTFRANGIYFFNENIEEIKDIKYVFGTRITKTVELLDGRTVEVSAILNNDGFISITIPNLEEIKKFDLALRKFITGVTDNSKTTDITNRYPVFKINADGKYVYEHTKEPVVVDTKNIVTYTLRIFNEGNDYGYASEVLDDIPEGLEFVPYIQDDGSINDKYKWTMYKILTQQEILTLPEGTEIKELDGKTIGNSVEKKKCIITTNPAEADYIVTNYLSFENGKKMTNTDILDQNTKLPYNVNLLKPFNPNTMDEPDYRDVKVQFKVVEPSTSNRIIINLAQITDDKDKYNEEAEDIDSKPNVWNEGEDDQDLEKIKVRYFDLSLVKWVNEAIIIEDGIERIEPGNNLEDLKNQYDHRLIYKLHPDKISNYTDLEPVVKVDIPKNKLASIVVKFKYKIRVYNEGQIDGYVKEITDYTPKNMKFVQEDNPLWKDAGNGKVVTNQLENKLLKVGGEPETVEIIYTWINGENNLGLLVNTAEISKDYNEFETPDIDSTPNNFIENEDDIDDAPVLISIRTGDSINITYIIVAAAFTIIIAAGAISIKKFVL